MSASSPKARSALAKLYGDVVTFMRNDGSRAAEHKFGWREPPRVDGPTNRIVWVPGDDASGDLGKWSPPKYPGRLPARPLATILELFTVYITGAPPEPRALESEEDAYDFTRELLDDWIRAVTRSAFGTFEPVSLRWLKDAPVLNYGATVRVVCAIQSMVPDSTVSSAPVDVKAVVAPSIVVIDHSTGDESYEVVPA